MKQKYKKIIGMSVAAMTLLSSSAYAGKIISDADLSDIVVEENKQFGFGGWNFDNVDVRIVNTSDFSTAVPGSEFDTETGIYTPMGAEMSFESDIRDINYSSGTPVVGSTVMGHLHGKDWPVGEPAGIKIINDDPKTQNGKPENCIMTSSYLEYQINDDNTSGSAYLDAFASGNDPRPVLCSSPFQSHKRYKINILPTAVEGVAPGEWGKPVDLVFNLDPSDDNATIRRYQVLQKANNYTGMRLDGIKIEVLDENGSVNDALTLSLGEGEGENDSGIVDGTVDIWDVNDMANMSHGLWGPYEVNKGVLRFDNGFFDYQRVYFDVNLSEDNKSIEYIGPMLGGNYQELFGNWLPSIWEPTGIFFDEDQNPATDNILQAFLGVAPGFTERTWYKRSVVYDPSTPNVAPVYTWQPATDDDFTAWSGEWYNTGPIEDVLNLGLNYIINVGLNSKIGETFTLRLTPHVDTNQTAPNSYAESTDLIEGMGDFNGDGIIDILRRNDSDANTSIWYMNADGTYTKKYIDIIDLDIQIDGVADFNADGIADILMRNTLDNTINIRYMQSNGTYTSVNIGTIKNTDFNIKAAADFNNDGIADILWRNPVTQYLVVWYMDSVGGHTYKNIGKVKNADYTIHATGDMNNDGVTDILWYNPVNKYIVTWYMNSDGTHTYKVVGIVKNTDYNIEALSDFNNDGIADILWHNPVNNYIVIWYMLSDGSHTFKVITTDKNGFSSIESAADFNNDGIADILWKEASDGSESIWYMNADGTYIKKTL